MQKTIIFLISLFITFQISGQTKRDKKTVTAAFYNVENLFDTINDPKIDDEEFLPLSAKKWDSERYNKKLDNIAKVIISFNATELPEIVGFAEVENKKVLEDLINKTSLKEGNYQIVHQDSPDGRGIDVALIYQPDEFKYVSHKIIPFSADYEIEYKLRDILYVKGIIGKKDTIHIFVNHWKSRSGGEDKTENQRISQSQNLRMQVDEILGRNKDAKILIMGDLNDGPRNTSVFKTLKANNNSGDPMNLFNLMLTQADAGKGTNSYRNTWIMLDNLIVSQAFLNQNKGFVVKENEGRIFDADWITFTNNKGEKSPNRTYGGNNYFGGFSDHYPVYVTFIKK